jgi:prepilin-type N-terminal cleavage/methylation domain-containing protein
VYATREQDSRGFTLVEVLIVIAVIGVLAAVVVFAVRGMADRGQSTACRSDASTIAQAAEAYFAQNSVQVLPPTGGTADRFELTVVSAGLLTRASTYYDLKADGTVVTTGAPCS